MCLVHYNLFCEFLALFCESRAFWIPQRHLQSNFQTRSVVTHCHSNPAADTVLPIFFCNF